MNEQRKKLRPDRSTPRVLPAPPRAQKGMYADAQSVPKRLETGFGEPCGFSENLVLKPLVGETLPATSRAPTMAPK